MNFNMNNVLSCCFPSTVVLVDDNVNFLESLRDILISKNIILKNFSNPIDALNYINETSTNDSLAFSNLTVNGEETTSDWRSILLNVNGIHNEIYNEERFSRISTVVADYSMPGLNGIELCSKIKSPSIQKILLTGVADEKVAIDAFNNGYINRFIKKDNPEIGEEVIDNVNRAINHYFSIYTEDLIKYIPDGNNSYLKDPIFANFFYHSCLCKDYIEYYMLDTFGSYMFLTEDGKASLLSVLPESEIERIIEIGIDSEEISEDVLKGLQSREYMLVCHSRTGTLPPISQWGRYLRPARRLEGYQTYYFSFTEGEMLDIDVNRLKSFGQFKLKNLNKDF